jgi:hypothetical protein
VQQQQQQQVASVQLQHAGSSSSLWSGADSSMAGGGLQEARLVAGLDVGLCVAEVS